MFSLWIGAKASADTMEPSAGLNPVVIGGSYELDAGKKSVKLGSDCNSYPSMKALGTLEVKADVPEVQIKSNTFLLALVSSKGEVTCVTDQYKQGGAELLRRPFKADTYQVFVGDQINKPSDKARVGVVKFLNTKRGYKFAWEASIEAKSVGKTLAEPLVVDAKTSNARGWAPIEDATNSCVGVKIQGTPELVVDVSEESSFGPVLSSHADLVLVAFGPLPESGGKIGSDCFDVGSMQVGTHKPGRYLYYVGAKTPVEASYSLVVMNPEESKRDIFHHAGDAGMGTDIEHRAATRVFPELFLKKDLAENDANREKLLMAAPIELFVYAAKDLDESNTEAGLKTLTPQGSTTALEEKVGSKKIQEFTYPKKDEPLLYLGDNYLLATDGGIFRVNKLDQLAVAPSASAVLPAAARLMWASLAQGMNLGGPEDQKAIAAAKKDAEKLRMCRNNVWKVPAKKLAGLNKQLKELRSHYMKSKAELAKIDRLSKQSIKLDKATTLKEKKVCKAEAQYKRDAKARLALIKTRAKRHEAILAAVKARFTK